MAERIALHRARRPPGWRTVEAPFGGPTDYADAATMLVEDLTLLLANLIERDSTRAEELATHEVEALCALEVNVILVSNEVGMGLVPPYPLGRVFRDALGRVNQRAAALVDEVYLTVAGLPLRLK
jgi:adenosylcobinamide kinase/adenosylcobinamide-phosphate guanylyltransferase